MRKKSKLSNILGVIGIILALIAILWGPKIYYFLWGDLKIDYKEDDVHVQDNKTYAKIEVINELGYSLEYVNGSVTLSCSGHDFQISSETFKLEGGYDFLAHGSKQTFLFSPDLFFVDLAKSCNVNCSDASWDNAKYLRTNNSHAELKEITSFEFFVDDSLKIVRKQHKPNEKILSKTCVNCDILIKIYAANIKQPFTKKESHKFVGGQTTISSFMSFIQVPEGYCNPECYLSSVGFLSSFEPCLEITEQDCLQLMCDNINKKYGIEIDCNKMLLIANFSSGLFSSRTLTFNE